MSDHTSDFLDGLKVQVREAVVHDNDEFGSQYGINAPWCFGGHQSREDELLSQDSQPEDDWHVLMEFEMVLAETLILDGAYCDYKGQDEHHADHNHDTGEVEEGT